MDKQSSEVYVDIYVTNFVWPIIVCGYILYFIVAEVREEEVQEEEVQEEEVLEEEVQEEKILEHELLAAIESVIVKERQG